MRAPLLLPGKLQSRRAPAQLNALPAGTALMYLRDRLSGASYLVDTGAARSVLPCHSTAPPFGPRLVGADGRQIRSWGTRSVPLQFGSHRFTHEFLLASVDSPILGLDFLSSNHLLVDANARQVLFADSLVPLSAPGSVSQVSPLVAALLPVDPEVRSLLAEFPTIVSASLSHAAPRHGVLHSVETTGRPISSKARRLDPAKRRSAEAEFRKMEAAGIVRRSHSPWSSPLHMVPKPDGSWRPCGNYRRLNNATLHDCYPLPNIQDFANNLHGSRFFSKIDLLKGYHQVHMSPADIPKTAIVTPFGLFELLRMPFGLKNSAQTFQCLMDRIFDGLPSCFVYLDDILVASPDRRSHLDHLRQVFGLLADNGLLIGLPKCEFVRSSVEYLGHSISDSGMVPLARHVQAIQEFPTPHTIADLQRFLGLINFYQRFLPGVAGVLKPLTDALAGSPKALVWSPAMVEAFSAAKASLVSATPLVYPAPSPDVSLAVDASSTHLGAVLQQRVGRSW